MEFIQTYVDIYNSIYLSANAEKTQVWRHKLGEKTKPRVGLVWSGGFRSNQPELWEVNERRNIKLAMFAIFKSLNIDFFSLQKGYPAESELYELNLQGWDGPVIKDFTASICDFSDTAALIENLDLIVTVDTSTAHLAAAMAKEVWMLNRFDSCWRWMLDRTDSPWYPTVTLFRQSEFRKWDDVMEQVKVRLFEKFNNHE